MGCIIAPALDIQLLLCLRISQNPTQNQGLFPSSHRDGIAVAVPAVCPRNSTMYHLQKERARHGSLLWRRHPSTCTTWDFRIYIYWKVPARHQLLGSVALFLCSKRQEAPTLYGQGMVILAHDPYFLSLLIYNLTAYFGGTNIGTDRLWCGTLPRNLKVVNNEYPLTKD